MPENTNEQFGKGIGRKKALESTVEKPTEETAGVKRAIAKETIEAKGSRTSALAEEDLSKVREEVEDAERKNNYVKGEWFDAWLEGNLRVPQATTVGTTPFIVEALLRDKKPDLERFSHSIPTKEQMQKLGAAMNAAHGAYNIPIGTEDAIEEILARIKSKGGSDPRGQIRHVTDLRLRQLWESEKFFVRSSIKKTRHRLSTGKYENKDLLHQIHGMATTSVEALRSEEGRRIAKEYRDLFDYSRQGLTQKDKQIDYYSSRKYELLGQLQQVVVDRIEEKNPEIANRIDPYPWGKSYRKKSFKPSAELMKGFLKRIVGSIKA